MTMQDLNNRQQTVIQNATSMAQLDIANLDAQTKLAAQNAQSFLQMDLANLNNRQQAAVIDAQMQQQALLSNQAAQNAARQFNAQSENQVNQFNASLASQIDQFNASQQNAMSQFNTEQENRQELANQQAKNQASLTNAGIDANLQQTRMQVKSNEYIANNQMTLQAQQFVADQEFRRDQFNAANAQAIAQADVAWKRQLATADTAAQNAANQQNAQNAFNMSLQEQQFLWQQFRDEAGYLRQQYENEETRKTQLYAVALGNEAAAGKDSRTGTTALKNLVDAIFPPGG